MTTSIVIDTTTIRQDKDGRFNINDLHRAAGGEAIHSPGQFFRLETTKALVTELANCADMHNYSPMESNRGRYGGTFVGKELVYAYAMWISPAFNLKVIRAYDRLATQGVAVHENAAADLLNDPLKYMKRIIAQAEVLVGHHDHQRSHHLRLPHHHSVPHRPRAEHPQYSRGGHRGQPLVRRV